MAINYSKFDQWLVPSSRMLLGLLVLANVSLAILLSVADGSPKDAPTADLPLLADAATNPANSSVRQNPPGSARINASVGKLPAEVPPGVDDKKNVEQQLTAENRGAEVVSEEQIFTPTQELAPRECRVWGPESNPEAFASLRNELRAQGSFPEIKALDVQAAADYLVLIDKLGSRDNAKRVTNELDRLEIDNFIITRDDNSAVISVGVFSRQVLAKRQLNKMLGLGYSAKMEQLQRSQTVFNLTAHVSVDSPQYTSSISSCLNIAQGR